jgi:hypothetical protein
MKVGIMQPYFFPYMGYYSLIKHTDLFILLDAVQYKRHGWIERNRVLKQNCGWLYLQVPLIKSKGQSTLIKDIRINNMLPWKQKILAQLKPYMKLAPNYKAVIELVNDLFTNEFDDIVTLNRAAIISVCNYLNIQATIKVFTEMDLDIEKPAAADEWALNICKAMGNTDEYWNPPGGKEFFDPDKFKQANIQLKFQMQHLKPYSQKTSEFEPGLSIIDVMMFNSINEINLMMDNYELI